MSSLPSPRFAAAYIRVSTEDQAELSPESQLLEIERYAQKEGLVLLQDHIYIDAGISGKKAHRRPAFMQMIAQAKDTNCPFSVVLVWKYSRFARNQEESIFYKSILRSKCNVDVVSISEPLIAGPFGSLIERIIEWMDEFYSVRLSQEVKRSMTVNAEKGKLQAAPAFGYQVENGVLVPKEDEAVYVRQIFDSVLAGKGLYAIARQLNAQGVRTHRGNPFENRTVEYILRNPVYIGKLRWNPAGKTRRDFKNAHIITADSTHPPLVSLETWEKANHKLDQIKAQWGYKARPTHELKSWTSGLVRCSACGATLIFSKPHFYKCNNYARGKCKHSQHIRADLLEEAILTKLEEDAASTATLAYDITYTPSHDEGEIARLHTSLRQLHTKQTRLQEAYLAGVLDLAAFASAKRRLDEEIRETQQTLSAVQAQTEDPAIQSALSSAISSALHTLQAPDASLEEKNNALRSIVDTCTFDKDTFTLSITYRVMLDEKL